MRRLKLPRAANCTSATDGSAPTGIAGAGRCVFRPDTCAQEILEVGPHIRRAIRIELRRHLTADLSVPQFRTLAVIDRNANVSLSDVTEHIRMALTLTRSGQAVLEASRAATRSLFGRQSGHAD